MDERHERFVNSLARVMQNAEGNEVSEPPEFGGNAGEPVPAVDPEDLKIVLQITKDVQARNPRAAIGAEIFQQACKPGADVEAVTYRSWLIGLANQFAPGHLERFADDALCHAAAKVPAQWMGVGIVRNGLPFDVNEFLRLCTEDAA